MRSGKRLTRKKNSEGFLYAVDSLTKGTPGKRAHQEKGKTSNVKWAGELAGGKKLTGGNKEAYGNQRNRKRIARIGKVHSNSGRGVRKKRKNLSNQ